MDPSRLVGTGDPQPKLACTYGLQDVVDARTSGDRVGGLGINMFVFDDAVGLVRRQLASAGFSAANAQQPDSVTIRILKIYMAQNNITKIPVVVYEVHVDQQSPFLIRSQLASMNWVGSQNEAYDAYARAFHDADAKLVGKLNEQCVGRLGVSEK